MGCRCVDWFRWWSYNNNNIARVPWPQWLPVCLSWLCSDMFYELWRSFF